jgi:hypothetical protein
MIEVMKGNSWLAGEIYQRQDEKYQRYNKQDRNAVLVRHSQHGTRKRNGDRQGRDDGADGGVKHRPVEQRGSTRRQCYSLPRNCVVLTLTMQELTAAKAGRLMSV